MSDEKIPENFFLPENRCDYFVTADVKKIWATELSILEEFIKVCDQYGLSYYANGGTLLGAIRHGGFIPWDNDIDVAMPRPDFDRLLQIGPKVFQDPLFFQTPITEKSRYFKTWVKLCHSGTTGGSYEDYCKGINCGIFIDIFPLDKVPEGIINKKLYIAGLDSIRKSVRFCFGVKPQPGIINLFKYYLRKGYYKFILGSPDAADLFYRYHKKAGRTWKTSSRITADVSHGYVERFSWETDEWASGKKMPFEHLNIMVPDGFDGILKKQYGNYHEIPEDKSTHDYLVFSPDQPYKSYFNEWNNRIR